VTSPDQVIGAIGVYAGAFAIGALSSVVPFVMIDVFVVWIALHASPIALMPLLALTAAGQLVGKLPMFFAVRRVAALPRLERHRARLDRWQRRWNRHPRLVLAASAAFGLPPFSIIATAAGTFAIRTRAFCAIVLAGRGARFAVVAVISLAAR
jgi:membrane protein YqaA with SNARE-associated domain